MPHTLQWKKFHPLSDQNAFICLVDYMGDDSSIVQAARVSYGKDEQDPAEKYCSGDNKSELPCQECHGDGFTFNHYTQETEICSNLLRKQQEQKNKNRQLIRYLMNHSHTTPFEMIEIKFMVQVPMDCWRQWIRHRTASVNEYSTRYIEALDFFQVTQPTEWRLQATDNKQGSSGFLTEWPEEKLQGSFEFTPGQYLSMREQKCNELAQAVYQERLDFGIAKEQARKDLPLSTYTRAYWKCDLHNIFNFLRLRMDSHAQLEIRSFANSMFEIVKGICPIACEAFEDYVLHAKRFCRMEMEHIKTLYSFYRDQLDGTDKALNKSMSMTNREWKEFIAKLR